MIEITHKDDYEAYAAEYEEQQKLLAEIYADDSIPYSYE